ncbi:MAG: hypothetical protein ACKVI3_07400 [Verrucomicrobiia bacterium]
MKTQMLRWQDGNGMGPNGALAEAVLTERGNPPETVGSYSYGEIRPGGVGHSCELPNQTVTLTTFAERTS